MQLGKALIGAIIGGALGIAALIAVSTSPALTRRGWRSSSRC